MKKTNSLCVCVCERVNKVVQVLAKLIKPKRERKYTHISNEKGVIIIENI